MRKSDTRHAFARSGAAKQSRNVKEEDKIASPSARNDIQTKFTAYGDGKLQIWPDLLARTGGAGQKYLEILRDILILTEEFSRHKCPTISTDRMKISDIDTFIATIKELGLGLDEISKECPR